MRRFHVTDLHGPPIPGVVDLAVKAAESLRCRSAIGADDMRRRLPSPVLFVTTMLLLVACGAPAEPAHDEVAGTRPGAAPSAPTEMETFVFLLGEWDCDGRWRRETNSTEHFRATWKAREALDGHVILEEYRAFWPNGETFVYGTNFRTFDTVNGRWTTRWHSALDGTGFELGQPTFSEDPPGTLVVTFINGDGDVLQRAIYRALGPDRFTWQGDGSQDGGESWDKAVMVIDCARQ